MKINKFLIILLSLQIVISTTTILKADSNNFPSYNTNCYTIDSTVRDGIGELKVITDKEVYLIGEKVNISIVNIGPVDLGGEPHLRITHITQEGIITVHNAPNDKLVSYILINESFNYTWDQIDTNGLQVEKGKFSILFYFVCCGGITERNRTNFKIQEEPIYIESIQGGFGISVILRNIGMNNSYIVNYSIDISGLILFGSNKEEQIDIIIPQEIITIHHNVIGIGFSIIKITVGNEIKTKNCFIIGPYIY